MPTKRLKDDEGNIYEIDIDEEEDDTGEEDDDEEDRKDREWLRARRSEWESSQSQKKPRVRRVKTASQKTPVKKAARRVLRIA